MGMLFFLLIAGIAQWALKASGFGLDVVVSLQNILVGLGISIFIGVVFGLLPSYQAARLNPVDAIRSK
jgi:ABC-type antimicrobial peptide transport system permease subunit